MDLFGFVPTANSLDHDTLSRRAEKLVSAYPADVEMDIVQEIELCSKYSKFIDASDMLKDIIHNNLTQTFLNIFVALRIYCSMFAASCEGERSFSTLKGGKNCLRSTVGQVRVSTLALLCVESELMK